MNQKQQMKNKKKTIKSRKTILRYRIALFSVMVVAVIGVVCLLAGFNKEEVQDTLQPIPEEKTVENYETTAESKKQENNYIVCLDPGHGDNDPGTMAGGRMEKDDNLKLTQKVKEILEQNGVTVIMTRDDDSLPSLKQRVKIANHAKADLFVSLHRNYYEQSPKINGIDIYINYKVTESDRSIGNALYEKLSAVEGMKVNEPKRGSATDENENYIVVDGTKMTACLVEMGYMSNKNDNQFFDNYIDNYASAIAEAIVEHLNSSAAHQAE